MSAKSKNTDAMLCQRLRHSDQTSFSLAPYQTSAVHLRQPSFGQQSFSQKRAPFLLEEDKKLLHLACTFNFMLLPVEHSICSALDN